MHSKVAKTATKDSLFADSGPQQLSTEAKNFVRIFEPFVLGGSATHREPHKRQLQTEHVLKRHLGLALAPINQHVVPMSERCVVMAACLRAKRTKRNTTDHLDHCGNLRVENVEDRVVAWNFVLSSICS